MTTPPRTIINAGSRERYDHREHWPIVRPGAADHEQHPSRMGNVLIYRDGRKEQIDEQGE